MGVKFSQLPDASAIASDDKLAMLDVSGNILTKIPVAHASSATVFGKGSTSNYGHLKISDTYASTVGAASDGVAASQKALYDVYKASSPAEVDDVTIKKDSNNKLYTSATLIGLGNVGNFKAVSTAASQGLTTTEQSNARTNIGLGNVGNFKAVSTVASQGLTSTEKSNARTNIDLGNVGNFKAVSTVASQGLTSTQKANARTNIGVNVTYVDYTITSSGWSNTTYSFEGTYPSSSYDILGIYPNSTTTDAQRKAWIAADCGGYNATNIITSHGTVPTINIPVTLVLLAK